MSRPRRLRLRRLATRIALCTGVTAAPALTAPVLRAQPTASPAPPRGRVLADSFWSPALGVRKRFVVYLPPSYDRAAVRRYPVAYYLHGSGDGEWDWVRLGGLAVVADSLAARGAGEAIIVMPDGDDGWYTTWNALGNYDACRADTTRTEPAASYCVPWPHYDDYIAHDLVTRVDSTYRTRPDRGARAAAGFSMGGYGALALALRYPEVFSAAASHSGLVSPLYLGPTPDAPPARYARTTDDMRRLLAAASKPRRLAFGTDTAAWWARDPGRLADRVQQTRPALMPALFADVGTEDQLADGNRAFRDHLRALGVPLAYHEWPGAHTWPYWRAHVGESLAWLLTRFPR